MIRPILKMGHPALRQVARAVDPKELATSEVQLLISDLLLTMRENHGAGLAAPQVGEGVRICVAEVKENPRYPELGTLPERVWVNPVVHILSPEPTVTMYEGCLSVPGLRGRVIRPAHIRVDSLDRSGTPQRDEFLGAIAAVVQHELDHLDGILFVDRAESATLTFLDELMDHVPSEQRLIVRGISPPH